MRPGSASQHRPRDLDPSGHAVCLTTCIHDDLHAPISYVKTNHLLYIGDVWHIYIRATISRRPSGHNGSGKTYDAPFRANVAWLTVHPSSRSSDMLLLSCCLSAQTLPRRGSHCSPEGRHGFAGERRCEASQAAQAGSKPVSRTCWQV